MFNFSCLYTFLRRNGFSGGKEILKHPSRAHFFEAWSSVASKERGKKDNLLSPARIWTTDDHHPLPFRPSRNFTWNSLGTREGDNKTLLQGRQRCFSLYDCKERRKEDSPPQQPPRGALLSRSSLQGQENSFPPSYYTQTHTQGCCKYNNSHRDKGNYRYRQQRRGGGELVFGASFRGTRNNKVHTHREKKNTTSGFGNLLLLYRFFPGTLHCLGKKVEKTVVKLRKQKHQGEKDTWNGKT